MRGFQIKWRRGFYIAVLIAVGSLRAGGAKAEDVPAEPVLAGWQPVLYEDSADEITVTGKQIQSIEYSSSDDSVAVAGKDGMISGVDEGNARIKVKVTYGEEKNPQVKEFSYDLRVKDNFTNYFDVMNGEIRGLTEKGKMLQEMYIPDYCDLIRVRSGNWNKILSGNSVVEKLFFSDYIPGFGDCMILDPEDAPKNLKEISLGRRMESFGYINGLSSLETITVHALNTHFQVRGGVLFRGKKLICYPGGKKDTDYKVPEDVKEIEAYAFSGAGNLERVDLAEGMSHIGTSAFQNAGLTEVEVPAQTIVWSDAFKDCRRLEKAVLPSKYYTADRLFKNCPVLKTAVVRNTTGDIPNNLFWNCPSLQEFQVSAGVSDYQAEDGVLFKKSSHSLEIYPMGKRDSSYTVPAGIRKIGRSAFREAANLKTLHLSSSLTEIEENAFDDCSGLVRIRIPQRVKMIECSFGGEQFTEMFRGCDCLKEITVDSLNRYYSSSKGVLYDRSGKKLYRYPQSKKGAKFTVPKSVTSINKGAFSGARFLQRVVFGDQLKRLGTRAFLNARALKSVTLPAKIKNIKNSAFQGCKRLTRVVIPDKVMWIPDSLFKNCTALREVVVGKSVRGVGEQAFSSCISLQKIVFRGKRYLDMSPEPEYWSESATPEPFYRAGSKNYRKLKIYLPKSTKSQRSRAKKIFYNRGLNKKAKLIFAEK